MNLIMALKQEGLPQGYIVYNGLTNNFTTAFSLVPATSYELLTSETKHLLFSFQEYFE